jgi:hypothetical protein
MDSTSPTSWPAANRLANEKSPYLLQHQNNPVDWRPWGEEAFAAARRENKPIFLSVGYSTCHWCHVMAHESFEKAETAAFLNAHFINIKVDREERPDVDRLYMAFVQATTGQGGWPMSVWLTPDLKPIAGGTYFPPDDRYGRPSFMTVLTRIVEAWNTERSRILVHSDRMIEALREHASPELVSEAAKQSVAPDAQPLAAAARFFARQFDPAHGGFGGAPKFPRPTVFWFLLRESVRQGFHAPEGRRCAEITVATLNAMAAGGIRDHLGGGFHRYSVDERWHVPHFEKMLYDQAQLAIAYLEAYQLAGDPRLAEIAREILAYVSRDLTSAEGGFYSAEDADSLLAHGSAEHAEGAFYAWTASEVRGLLGPDADLFADAYGIEPDGNVSPEVDAHGEFAGKNVLYRRRDDPALGERFGLSSGQVAEKLAAARQMLLAHRLGRPRPHLDDKIITAWNGLMISAYSRAHQALGDSGYLRAAARAAGFLRRELVDPESGDLRRSWRGGASPISAFADDHAFLIQGLLDLYEAGFDIQWLKWAHDLQKRQDALFYDRLGGGYFSTSGKDASVLLRMKDDYDGAEPAAGSVAALNLLRLASMLGSTDAEARARATLGSLRGQLESAPAAVPMALAALDFNLSPPVQIVIKSRPGDPRLPALLRPIHERFLPRRVILMADGDQGEAWLREKIPALAGMAGMDGQPTAYVCRDFACHAPTTQPDELRKRLAGNVQA